MDKGAWQATYSPWGCKGLRYYLATKNKRLFNIQHILICFVLSNPTTTHRRNFYQPQMKSTEMT